MGIGLNYAGHAAEANMELPEEQLWFSKQATCIADPYGPIQLPKVSDKLDYEAELVFVIGKPIRHASLQQARDAIFGYCVGNDVSVRDRSEEHTSELQSLMRISYAVFCLKKKKKLTIP